MQLVPALTAAAITICALHLPPPAAAQAAAAACAAGCQDAAAAVAAADAADGRAAPAATYRFAIASVGTPGTLIYLNSQPDYRDAANVAVALNPYAAGQLRKKYPDLNALIGKTIVVTGAPRRHAVRFRDAKGAFTTVNGLAGYYQTRISLMNIGALVTEE